MVRTAPALLAALALAATAAAEEAGAPLAVGGTLPALALEDQHGESGAVDAGAKLLLFTRDMDAGRVVRAALEEDGAALLESRGAVYVSDVSRMPGLILRLMARPSMRRRPYRMLLDTEGTATRRLPSAEGKVSVIALDALRIEAIDFVDEPGALRAALGAPPAGETSEP